MGILCFFRRAILSVAIKKYIEQLLVHSFRLNIGLQLLFSGNMQHTRHDIKLDFFLTTEKTVWSSLVTFGVIFFFKKMSMPSFYWPFIQHDHSNDINPH